MWIIIEKEKILKVAILKENTDMLFVENYPGDLLENPGSYEYVDGEFIRLTDY